MSIGTLILGNSGSGKSTSLRNLDPSKTLVIQCIKKPLPFRAAVVAEHADNNHGREYMAAIAMIEAHAAIWSSAAVAVKEVA